MAFSTHLWFGSACLVGLVSACAGSPASSTATDGNEATSDASSGQAADAAPADGGTASVDAGRCGFMADADYLMHMENLDQGGSCGVQEDQIGRYSIPSVAGPDCTIDRDLDICVTTIACKTINGRFEMSQTHVWNLKGRGPLMMIVEEVSTSTFDPMFASTRSCRYRITYTKQ